MPRNPLRYLPFADKWTPTDSAERTRPRRTSASKRSGDRCGSVTVIRLAERRRVEEPERGETVRPIAEFVPLRARNLRAEVLQVFRDAQAGRT